MHKGFYLLAIGIFAACNAEKGTEAPVQKTTTMTWSLSGSLGASSFAGLAKDTSVVSISSRSGSSIVKIDNYDSSKFQDSISIGHLQNTKFVTVKIDNTGSFTFDNLNLFGFSDGGHSIRVSPRPKPNVKLVPESILVFGSM